MRKVSVSPDAPERAVIEDAGAVVRSGGLVAFPTETVYGLGANALDAAAVGRIYDAKGRPAINPLIVHVADIAMARRYAAEWNDLAETLAREFWPGPLTLVVRKSPDIPDLVTAGGATVGLRMPSHPVALALIEAAGVPIAAPSANRSNQISPTSADHVQRGLGDRVDVLVDGGPTSVGIESTVVDVTGENPRVLRPGMITPEQIARAAGRTVDTETTLRVAAPRSPGMLGRHYAPMGRVLLYEGSAVGDARAAAADAIRGGLTVGAMVFESLNVGGVIEHTMPVEAAEYARHLYGTLHALDLARCDLILAERPPRTPEWHGVLDRLERAATAA